jgi:predicted nucleic acid-binding protein
MAGIIVVDTSVAVKWYVPEPRSEHAVRLLNRGDDLTAPDSILIEVASVLWKKVTRTELPPDDAVQILETFRDNSPIRMFPIGALVRPAFDIAIRLRCSPYDALFLALAIAESAEFVTDDERFVTILRGTGLESFVRSLRQL